MMRFWRLALLLAAVLALPAWAEDEKKEEPKAEPKAEEIKIEVTSEPLLTGLDNPTGVAVQPGSNNVFVAESGALKVIRMDATKPNEKEDVITGFPKDVYGKGPMYDIGPLGLAFLDKSTLVVGDGGQPDGSELVRVYDVPEPTKSVAVDAMKYKLGPIGPSGESKGEGNFYGVAVTPEAIYVTSNGDDTKGWILRAPITEGKPGELATFIATKEHVEVDAPVGIAINRHGHLAIGQMGEINKPNDSLLSFYGPKSKKLLMNRETKLFDIAGLAYSPKTGLLYAVDFAWMDTAQGGLFRIDDDEKGGVTVTKVLALDKPTALAFNPAGELFVTVIGTAKEGETAKPGQLLKIKAAKGDL